MPPRRTSKRWRTCPGCGVQQYDPRAEIPGRKWFKCGECGHVWHPEPDSAPESTHPAVSEQKPELSPKKTETLWEKLWGG